MTPRCLTPWQKVAIMRWMCSWVAWKRLMVPNIFIEPACSAAEYQAMIISERQLLLRKRTGLNMAACVPRRLAGVHGLTRCSHRITAPSDTRRQQAIQMQVTSSTDMRQRLSVWRLRWHSRWLLSWMLHLIRNFNFTGRPISMRPRQVPQACWVEEWMPESIALAWWPLTDGMPARLPQRLTYRWDWECPSLKASTFVAISTGMSAAVMRWWMWIQPTFIQYTIIWSATKRNGGLSPGQNSKRLNFPSRIPTTWLARVRL